MKGAQHDKAFAYLQIVGEIADIAAALNGLPRARCRQRHHHFGRAVAHILHACVDMQGIARIKQRVRQIELDFQLLARANTGPGNPVNLRRITARGAVPIAKMPIRNWLSEFSRL